MILTNLSDLHRRLGFIQRLNYTEADFIYWLGERGGCLHWIFFQLSEFIR